MQEHHLGVTECSREEAWARGVGWSTSLCPAVPTGRGGTSGGVGLLTRSFRGLGLAPGRKEASLVDGRAAIWSWNGGGVPGGLIIANVYLECGMGMNDGNWDILKAVAEEVKVIGRPFVIGGDFQQSPKDLAEAGALNLFDEAEVVCASDGAGAAGGKCCTRGKWSTIDFFIVSRMLAPKVQGCELVLEAALRPHRPVALKLRRGGALPLQRALAGPRAFPRQRPVGPARPTTVSWTSASARVSAAKNVDELDEVVQEWFKAAEGWLLAEFDVDPAHAKWMQGRGGGARFRWERPQIKKMAGRAKTSTIARSWFWLADRLGELAQLSANATGGRWEHRQALLAKVAAWCAPTGQIDFRALWAARLGGLKEASDEQLKWWQGLALGIAEAEHDAFAVARRRDTRQWVKDICAGAAGVAHKVTKVPAGWRPDPHGGDDHGLRQPLGRQARVDELANQWRKDIWGTRAAKVMDEDFEGMVFGEMARPSAEAVRAAARKFPHHTGLGADQWHPRHFEWLPTSILEGWVDIMMKAESSGWIPSAMNMLTVVFIPKGAVGVRPIGLFTSSQRLWGKLRREVAERWERDHERGYWWGGSGRSVESCVWNQALNGEFAAATGRKAASIMLDLVKAYETLGHRMCAQRFRDAEVPMQYARWCLRCYAGPRVLRVDGAYSEVFSVDSSIVAGCAGATTLLKAVLMRTCDEAMARALEMATQVRLYVVVDDITIQGVSASDRSPESHAKFEQDLCMIVNGVTESLETDVGGTVSEDKSVVLGCDEVVVEKVLEGTGRRWTQAVAARNLGIDTSYSAPSAMTQKDRIANARARAGRFGFLRGFGGQVAAVVRSGPMASMVFGTAAQGAYDAALMKMRSAVGACAFGALGGASLTMKFMLSEIRDLDPVFVVTLAPLKAWAVEVWAGQVDTQRKMAVAFDAALKATDGGKNLELKAPGPTVAVLVALRRLGWRAESYQCWVTDGGVQLHLREACPRSVLMVCRRAIVRWQWQHVAARYPSEFEGLEVGGDLQPLKRALSTKGPLTAPQRQLLYCAASRRLWPESRRAAEGYQSSELCAACGDEKGTLRHALYRCPATAMSRCCQDLGPIEVFGAKSVEEHHLYSRGVLADVRHEAPPPCSSLEVVWDPASTKGYFEGHVYLDGSRLHGDDELLSRAGWGVVEVRVVNKMEARAWGPFVGLVQCIDAAEVQAATMAMKFGVPPLNLYSDSDFFVKGWRRGRQWCTSPGRAHADVWREFWRTLQDFGGENVVQVTKVKAHATLAMVEGGLVTEVDRWGNQLADEAAKRGAQCHPGLDEFFAKLHVRRVTSERCAHWLGVGLEAAQRTGSLPSELTMAQKMERPRQVAGKRVEVVRDATWHREQRQEHMTSGTHPTHSLHQVGEYVFCAVCGCYGAQKLFALSRPCEREATAARRYLLNRMLVGCHPRTGEHLGEVTRATAAEVLPLTATRRSHRA